MTKKRKKLYHGGRSFIKLFKSFVSYQVLSANDGREKDVIYKFSDKNNLHNFKSFTQKRGESE